MTLILLQRERVKLFLWRAGDMELISELLPELGSLPDFQPENGAFLGSTPPTLPARTSGDVDVKREAPYEQPNASSSSGSQQGWASGDVSEAASHHRPYATTATAKGPSWVADQVQLHFQEAYSGLQMSNLLGNKRRRYAAIVTEPF